MLPGKLEPSPRCLHKNARATARHPQQGMASMTAGSANEGILGLVSFGALVPPGGGTASPGPFKSTSSMGMPASIGGIRLVSPEGRQPLDVSAIGIRPRPGQQAAAPAPVPSGASAAVPGKPWQLPAALPGISNPPADMAPAHLKARCHCACPLHRPLHRASNGDARSRLCSRTV